MNLPKLEVFYRCSWCNKILWPVQALSSGGTMHERCALYVDRINAETDEQYWETWEQKQARLRWEQEDLL